MYISPVFQQVAMATSPAVLQKKESPLAKLMISGSVAWTFELFGGHYIEVLKIAKQTSDLSYAQITKNMVKEKGLAGVLDGYFPWGSIQCFAKGATLGFGQALGRQMLDGRVSDSTAEVLSGGVGGGFQGLVMSPILLLKTRVITGNSRTIILMLKVNNDNCRSEIPGHRRHVGHYRYGGNAYNSKIQTRV